jgi:hypothetical protein
MGFNATFGVSGAQSGLSDGMNLFEATGLRDGAKKIELARYAATALANADAGIAYRYRFGEVIQLYRDAIGAEPGPETIETVLAKPSARDPLACPPDLATRRLKADVPVASVSSTEQKEEIAASPTPVAGADAGTGEERIQIGNEQTSMIVLGVVPVFGLIGLRYRHQHKRKLRRAARWR